LLKRSIYWVSIFILFFAVTASHADFLLDRQYPVGVYNGINANFGQFRSRYGTYKAHDGIDYRAVVGIPVCPIAPGTARVHSANDTAWGKYIIVEHSGGFQTRYAHLNSISVGVDTWVDTSTILGLSGSTEGGKIPGMGPPLHFGLGLPDVLPANTKNPIVEGLKQPFYGELKIIEDPTDYRKIKLLGTGIDGTFDGDNEVLQTVKPNQAVRAVIRAYHRSNDLDSNPYKIVFEVENTTDSSWPKRTKEIVFDNMTRILANFDTDDGYYCFAQPCVTYASSESNYADYYFVKFYPTAGTYKITAKIYSCYRDGPGASGFHLTTPSAIDNSWVERTITVGLNGSKVGDLDFYDPNYSYAWLPDDIANRGVMLASVPAPASTAGVRTSGVSASGASAEAIPEVFYAFANNNIITHNLIDVDPNLQQKALIEARATPEANWLVEIKNEDGTAVVDRIAVAKQGWLRAEWGGAGKSDGTYTFTVTASNAAGMMTCEARDTITIDSAPPLAMIYTVISSVSTADAEPVISTRIRPYENLRSLLVNVVKNDYSLVEERIYSTPFAEKDTEAQVDWEDAIAYPDGYYRLQYVMTDVAGNINKMYSPIVSVNKSGSYIPPSGTMEAAPEPTLPTLLPYEQRPIISDIAFDSAGNQYVLYGRYDKIVPITFPCCLLHAVEKGNHSEQSRGMVDEVLQGKSLCQWLNPLLFKG